MRTDTRGCSLSNDDERHQHNDRLSSTQASPVNQIVEGSFLSQFTQEPLSEVLSDDEWNTPEEAHLILLDMPREQRQLSRDMAFRKSFDKHSSGRGRWV